MITDFLEKKKSRLLKHLKDEKNFKSLKIKADEVRKKNKIKYEKIRIKGKENTIKEESIFQQRALDEGTLIQKKIINDLIELEKEKMIDAFNDKKELAEIKEKLKLSTNEFDKIWFKEKEREMISLNEETDEQVGGKNTNISEKVHFPNNELRK